MKSKMFLIYDSKVEAYLTPHFLRSTGEAIRAFTAACNDPQTQFNKYPSDFTYFEIGEYDDETGLISLYEAKKSLGTALEFINPSVETVKI